MIVHPTASAVLIWHDHDSTGHVLHIRPDRSDRWILPCGHREPGETSRTTAIRETVDTVGVDLTDRTRWTYHGPLELTAHPVPPDTHHDQPHWHEDVRHAWTARTRHQPHVTLGETIRGAWWCPLDQCDHLPERTLDAIHATLRSTP